MRKLYTIGHSSHSVEYFVCLLKNNGINCLVDVRSVPYSKYTPQFNMGEIKKSLNSSKIYYLFLGKELGARHEDRNLWTKEGYLDFEKVSKTSFFRSGIERIKAGIERGFNVALMCTEKDPIDCHRSILVAREFHRQKYIVNNILEKGEIQTQDNLEERLLDMYFPNRMQMTLFNDHVEDDAELIKKAYLLRNQDIGYIITEEEESLSSEVIYHRVH